MTNETLSRLLHLQNILKERTDEDHHLTTKQLQGILHDEYGYDTYRQTIKSNIDILIQNGENIAVKKSTQNQYNYAGWSFSIPELKAMIKAVTSAPNIPEEMAESIISRLLTMNSPYKVEELKSSIQENTVHTSNLMIEPLIIPFTVCKIEDYSLVDWEEPFIFTAQTGEEKSLVCPTKLVPPNTTDREDGWQAFRIHDHLDFSLIGILAYISSILAENNISVFVVSSFNTDYVFVKEENYYPAI